MLLIYAVRSVENWLNLSEIVYFIFVEKLVLIFYTYSKAASEINFFSPIAEVNTFLKVSNLVTFNFLNQSKSRMPFVCGFDFNDTSQFKASFIYLVLCLKIFLESHFISLLFIS